MNKSIKHIVIVGGGTAGWITAGKLASEHLVGIDENAIEITLIESPNVKPIGVGEGTWPSMRSTLKSMGIAEADLLAQCDASFKQGSKFVSWTENDGSHYYHPFTLPADFFEINLAEHWLKYQSQVSFADAVSFQSQLAEKGKAPKAITTPEYSFFANYGYHLDAGKFSAFLQKHCTEKLNVTHILDDVIKVNNDESGDIASLSTKMSGELSGDLFIDCSGLHGLLLDKHYQVPFVSKKHILFNDTALAVQVPYQNENDPIASATISTAQSAGWIWDIGLPTRRGVGHVYSSTHTTDKDAEAALREYIKPTMGKDADTVEIRKISFKPGHREKIWHRNCVAVGMTAGFIEPLEASALALIEQSANMISQQLPQTRESMDVVAERFNAKFLARWQQIVEFLKLHYVLSQRDDTQYWRDNKNPDSIPDSLMSLLAIWKTQTPYTHDSVHTEELFPPASYQYVYYGMHGSTHVRPRRNFEQMSQMAEKLFQENQHKTNHILNAAPTNRDLLNKIKEFGLSKV